MKLKRFQDLAIENIKSTFYDLWKAGHENAPLVFKSPTGSGKTIMMAEFLYRIRGESCFDPDKCYVWISKGDLAQQSKNKLEKYYSNGSTWTNCLDLNDLSNGKLKKNEIFFVNWEKIVSKKKDDRKLRKNGESNISFDDFIKNTHSDNRDVILIVDESHHNLNTELAKEIVEILNPRISIHVSATPKKIPTVEDTSDFKAGFNKVNNEDVVADGLIKSSVKIMPKEEIEKLDRNNIDLDELLLNLAIEKQQEIKQRYESLSIHINPLVLVQLPNDEVAKKDIDGQNKLFFTKKHLAKKGFDNEEIAVWLSNEKENLEDIVKNNSTVKVLVFKQAIATGWDCPRAHVLVSFREMKNPIFHTQVLGRILRMPEAKHYNDNLLDNSYCYTNYSKNEFEADNNEDGANQHKIHLSTLKDNINNISLPSIFLSRTDYNDLGSGINKGEVSFESIFIKTANDFFQVNSDDTDPYALKTKGFDIDATSLNNSLIVDAEITTYDDFVNKLKSADVLDHEASYEDVRKCFDMLIYAELNNQEESSRFGNIARSYGKLKSALNVWLKRFIPKNPPLYAIVCNDLLKGEKSILKKVIEQSLKTYKPIRNKETLERAKRAKQELTFSLQSEYNFESSFSEYNFNKNALDPFYANFKGDERKFAEFLDGCDVDWWFKNADNGKEALGIEYLDYQGTYRVFYPDFIIRKRERAFILDTKSGFTAKEAIEKAEALYDYCQKNKGNNVFGTLSKEMSSSSFKDGDINLSSGIVQLARNNVWKFHNGKNYSSDINIWEDLAI